MGIMTSSSARTRARGIGNITSKHTSNQQPSPCIKAVRSITKLKGTSKLRSSARVHVPKSIVWYAVVAAHSRQL